MWGFIQIKRFLRKPDAKLCTWEGGMKKIQLQRELWFWSGCNLSLKSISSEGICKIFSTIFLVLTIPCCIQTDESVIPDTFWHAATGGGKFVVGLDLGFGFFFCASVNYILFFFHWIIYWFVAEKKEFVISLQSQHYNLNLNSASPQMLENLLQPKQSDFVIECGGSAVKEIRSEMRKGWVSLVGEKQTKTPQNFLYPTSWCVRLQDQISLSHTWQVAFLYLIVFYQFNGTFSY